MFANDLVTAPVPGLIRRLAVPVSIGFFFNTMFNVVDTFYAGQFDTTALAALSLSFPVFFVLIATDAYLVYCLQYICFFAARAPAGVPTGPRSGPSPGRGIPASLNMMSVALGIFIITWFLSRFGQQTVAAYGAATRIEQIVLLPALGLNVAALTLSAQNGGAGRYDRVRTVIRTVLSYGAAIMAIGSAFVFFGARPLLDLFTDDREVVDIGAHYLRIAAFIQYAYVILFVNTSALQGLKLPSFALWAGLYRQIVAPFTLFWLTTRVWDLGLDGIWWSIFGISWSAALVAVVFAQQRVKKLEADA